MDNIDLIYASKFKAAASAIKKLCNSAQISCYTLLDDSENEYIFKDLKPSIFLCTEEYLEEFKKSLLHSIDTNHTIRILCSDQENENFNINWPKNIDTFNFVENIKNLLISENIDG